MEALVRSAALLPAGLWEVGMASWMFRRELNSFQNLDSKPVPI